MLSVLFCTSLKVCRATRYECCYFGNSIFSIFHNIHYQVRLYYSKYKFWNKLAKTTKETNKSLSEDKVLLYKKIRELEELQPLNKSLSEDKVLLYKKIRDLEQVNMTLKQQLAETRDNMNNTIFLNYDTNQNVAITESLVRMINTLQQGDTNTVIDEIFSLAKKLNIDICIDQGNKARFAEQKYRRRQPIRQAAPKRFIFEDDDDQEEKQMKRETRKKKSRFYDSDDDKSNDPDYIPN